VGFTNLGDSQSNNWPSRLTIPDAAYRHFVCG
jgi:hypothetical protein